MSFHKQHTSEDISKFFAEFDQFLKRRMAVGVIGGVATMQYNAKVRTKDIALCFFDHSDIEEAMPFLQSYSQESNIIIEYGFPGRYPSRILNEDMFFPVSEVPGLQSPFLTKVFDHLQIKLLPAEYLILVKLEAATSKSSHSIDAEAIARNARVSKERLLKAYEEYRPELELVPRYKTELEILVQDVYNDPEFKLR
jgi:hypothetical protein